MENKIILNLTKKIIKTLPKFFDDFEGWEYSTGVDAGKDFKSIYNIAKKINKQLK